MMPTPDELQQLSDDIRHVGAMLVQIANDGDPDLLLMIVNVLNQCAMRPAIWAREVKAMEVDQIASAAIERARSG